MGFSRRIQYFLVHSLGLSNNSAKDLIGSGKVEIDGVAVFENCFVTDEAEIRVDGKVARQKKTFVYYAFYKPAGFESTLNTAIDGNIAPFFEDAGTLAIAGRLDKQSEGLLLLSNNGKWVEAICHPDSEKEKEYLVQLDKAPDELFITSFRKGVKIGAYTTRPCYCERTGEKEIRVILTEGKNRQIRRMCKNLGYTVLNLKRNRIDAIELNGLEAGEKRMIHPEYAPGLPWTL